MRALPLDIGVIHFVGIGGIGMSGIAEVLLNPDFAVSGTAAKETGVPRKLQSRGARIAMGHAAENLGDAQVVARRHESQHGLSVRATGECL